MVIGVGPDPPPSYPRGAVGPGDQTLYVLHGSGPDSQEEML